MAHEVKKVMKIIDEILVYICSLKNKKIDVSIDLEKDTIVKFTFKNLPENEIKRLKEIKPKREVEFEEYMWELLGETDTQFDLRNLVRLIDSLEIEEKNGNFEVTIIRKKDMPW